MADVVLSPLSSDCDANAGVLQLSPQLASALQSCSQSFASTLTKDPQRCHTVQYVASVKVDKTFSESPLVSIVVEPVAVADSDPLHTPLPDDLERVQPTDLAVNTFVIESLVYGQATPLVLRGPGAGLRPTVAAIMSDIASAMGARDSHEA